MRLATVQTTQPQSGSLWCGVHLWALRGGLHCQPLAVQNNWCQPHPMSALTPRLPNDSLPVSPLPRRLATVKSTQCNHRPTPITLQTSHHCKTLITFRTSPSPDQQDKMELDSPAVSRVSRSRYSPLAALPASSASWEMGSSKGPEEEEVMLGGFPCPDVGGASQEAEAESARIP
jgi:hypothetical protein